MKLKLSIRYLLLLVRDWNLKGECWLDPFHAGQIPKGCDLRPRLRGAIAHAAREAGKYHGWLLDLVYDFDDEVLQEWERKKYGEGDKGKRKKIRHLRHQLKIFRTQMAFARHKLRRLPRPVPPPPKDLFEAHEQQQQKGGKKR